LRKAFGEELKDAATSEIGPSRKWCHRDTASEMHRLVDVGLLANVMKKVKPPSTQWLGPTHDGLTKKGETVLLVGSSEQSLRPFLRAGLRRQKSRSKLE
jgi:hypothetical protein